jgi:3-deoxy-D-manno-octulosonate 8-phosphate phosphatase (KDO 8-P phosphatase)
MPWSDLTNALAKIRLIVFDVDGVLTDGSLSMPHQGGGRRFDVKDGFGFYLARQAGLRLALCSGKDEPELRARAEALKVDLYRLGRLDKAEALAEILKEAGLSPEEAAFVGDDLFDLPAMAAAGLALAPADARPEVRAFAHHVLDSPGGRGAGREVIEAVLKARGDWQRVTEPFLRTRDE